ncbi:DoxX family protein [Celeribacter arenosi]|uniref:DoxX family protein n=1 Tax=Celeribacter arenosi TaxID=792649 RepID=A0ABP7JUV1_9RHOB
MTTIQTNSSKKWNIGLWVAQVALAAMFAMAGFMKLTSSPADMAAMGMLWAENAPVALIKFIGLAEVLGAIGVILPAATRIKPDLTKLAALGLATIMVLASGVHIFRGEFEVLPVNFVLFALAALVIWGRNRKAPIAPRT